MGLRRPILLHGFVTSTRLRLGTSTHRNEHNANNGNQIGCRVPEPHHPRGREGG
jgi:hypothetical protein